jgi:KUP system potassium uptake protein
MSEVNINKFSYFGLMIAFGIVFGDLGTSPLYTFTAIIGSQPITETLILGSVSAIFWTLTFQTTLKYVFITMRADNNGEGGIFSLFAIIRKQYKWAIWPAIIGGSFMIADSLITPPISVTSAIEGLKPIAPQIPIMPIALVIIVVLFLFQQSGTKSIGKYFGPTMLVWFGMIAILGFVSLAKNPSVLKAINPMYAVQLIFNTPNGFWVLGGVFLCSTGAEALYADMGHVGRRNIQIAWIFIKISLLLCYFGEASLLMDHIGQTTTQVDPFYGLVPSWFLIPAIVIATFATIIASEALICGTFTLFNEAVRLNIWPKLRISFPSELRGQVYVPSINWLMMFGCIGVILYFKESANMEAAFGLSVTLTMLMTTILLSFYLHYKKIALPIIILMMAVYLTIELTFLTANLKKFSHGGWITFTIGFILVMIMFVWQTAKAIKNQLKRNVLFKDFEPLLLKLHDDTQLPKFATHLAYLTVSEDMTQVEERIMESILYQAPKRADFYWFVHVTVDDEPYTVKYTTEVLSSKNLVHINFKLGFRIVPRVNLLFCKVIEELVKNKEISIPDSYYSYNPNFKYGDIRFVVMKSFLSFQNELPFWKNMMMKLFFILDILSLPDAEAFGLDYNNVIYEKVPIIVEDVHALQLVRDGAAA